MNQYSSKIAGLLLGVVGVVEDVWLGGFWLACFVRSNIDLGYFKLRKVSINSPALFVQSLCLFSLLCLVKLVVQENLSKNYGGKYKDVT